MILIKIYERVKQLEKKTGKQMRLKFIPSYKVEDTASPEPDSTVKNTNSKCGLLSPINIHPLSLHEIAYRATRVKGYLLLQQTVVRTCYTRQEAKCLKASYLS